MHAPAVTKHRALLRVEQQMLHSVHMRGGMGRARQGQQMLNGSCWQIQQRKFILQACKAVLRYTAQKEDAGVVVG